MLKEFKAFIMRGNVIDLAVGVIIGGAFGKIVSSLVNDILMPIIGLLLGRINFSNLKWPMNAPEGAFAINYGNFIQSVVDFLIVALAIFLFIKFLGSFKRKKEEEPAQEKPTKEEALLTEIRDLLKEKTEE